ncbi:MAG: GAF domain-containing protein [Clostridia bacterium]|nr:GAF domain-containing protein [Clostridia bacterium]
MTDYRSLIKQTEALAEISSDPIPVMANVSALLFYSMNDINWAGFYIVKDGALLLGPFQGKVACVKIARGKGVCGSAWDKDMTQLVPDVHAFPGHIACDGASRSEIVVPIHRNGEVIAVLDIDSPIPSRFTEDDAAGLEELVFAIEGIIAV